MGNSQEPNSAAYSIKLTTTCPHLGGLRWWFTCPLMISGRECRQRVAKLYLPPTAHYFGCRHCHELTYTSCQKSRKYDPLDRLIAMRMGSDMDMMDADVIKKKSKHKQKKFALLCNSIHSIKELRLLF